MSRETTNQRLRQAAADRFYSHGIAATSVDHLAAAADVSKPTLYSHFGSKQELVQAVLCDWDRERRTKLGTIFNLPDVPPAQKILDAFAWLADWINGADFRGCGLVNLGVELLSENAADVEIVVRHKQWIQDELERLCVDAGFEDAPVLAEQLLLIMEGATVLAAFRSDRARIGTAAKTAAMALIS